MVKSTGSTVKTSEKSGDKQMERALAIRTMATELVVTNQEQYDAAGQFLLDVKAKMKEVEAAMDPQCKAAHAAWQTALAQKKQYLKPFEDAETIVKKAIGSYTLEQRRIAEEAQRKADEERQRQEEKERQKLLKKAEKAAAKGNEDLAEDLQEQAANVFVPSVVVTEDVAKVAGVTTTDDWDIEVVNLPAFLIALGEGTIQVDPEKVISIKVGPLKQYLKLTGKKTIPGCHCTPSVVVSGRAK